MEEDQEQRRQLVRNKVTSVADDCHAVYEAAVEEGLKSSGTMDEFKAVHKRAAEEAEHLFQEYLQLMRQNEAVLREKMKFTREVVERYLRMERSQELQGVRELTLKLAECRQLYGEEMETYCTTPIYIPPGQLDKHHEEVCKGIFEKICQPSTAGFVKEGLQEEMGTLYLKYQQENKMKLNYAEGVTPAIGIHLGYRYCCVAVFFNGEVIPIPNRAQGNIEKTPCYVTYNPDGTKTIGEVSRDQAHENPECALYDMKKLIGKRMSDPQLQRDMQFWPFSVVEDEGVPKINVSGQLLCPEQVSAEVLAGVRGMAEQYLGLEPGSVTQAAITTPAYFTDSQRQATMDAGELAGLEVLAVLPDPTAAVLAYSWGWKDNAKRKVIVFDFGGETLDVAVVEVTPAGIGILGQAGDTYLGGEDFDSQLVQYCARKFHAEQGIDLIDRKNWTDPHERVIARRALRRLQRACENAKKNLSLTTATTVSVDALYEGMDLRLTITRPMFEAMSGSLFQRAIRIVQSALDGANVEKGDIDGIILVGGSTHIPKLQEMLSDFFGGRVLNTSIHPEKVLAYGAAVKAAMLKGQRVADIN